MDEKEVRNQSLDETQQFDPEKVQEEASQLDLEQTRQFEPVEGEEFSLEDIIKEFGGVMEEMVSEEVTEEPDEEEASEETTVEEIPEKAEADGQTRVLPDLSQATEEKEAVTSDTIRLDTIDQAELQMSMVQNAQPVDDEADAKEPVDPFTSSWEPEYDQPIGDYVPPQPIIFHPRARVRELKRKLVAGPEKQYYVLLEKGLGKLQAAIFLSLLVVLMSVGSTVLYALGMVAADRVKLMIFGQLLAMMFSALLGSFQLVEGCADLLKKRFSMNSLLLFTFVACLADGVMCLLAVQRIPCCAAFSLTMTMSLWGEYHKRYTKLGQLDTLRKANYLDGIGVTEDYFEGDRGLLRFEGQVEDFMNEYDKVGTPESRLNRYSVIALFASLAIGVTAGVLELLSGGLQAALSGFVQVLAVTLLAALPATSLVTATRPFALVERKLHQVGTVICGWNGVKTLCGKAVFPLFYGDLFPAGTVKLNGVKFYGSRQPDEIVAYAAAVMEADDGGLAPLFAQLLASRNGMHYDVAQMRAYDNGGIGGEVEGEAVLVGSISFLKEMGVEIPEGIARMNQAVCVAVDGELCGLFAITYEKSRSSAAGITTLCSYRGLKPVLIAHDFSLTENFLKSKFGINPKRIVMPDRQTRERLAQVQQPEGSTAAVLTTKEGLAPFAYGVTGARALRTASNLGVVIHLLGGILGMAIMLTLTILGQLQLLTPLNMFLYHLVWLIPGLLTTEWTRSI